ncbi:MAG: hypothetical protein Ct9H300mP15_22970 [Gemmatimonadota bacterium]|nr:MAG: hypothetical protein Ct9H300mP15_22970 [Gemmatimonadota bacterium]
MRFDSYLRGFEELTPALVRAYDQLMLQSFQGETPDQVIFSETGIFVGQSSHCHLAAIFLGEETRRLDPTEREFPQQQLKH